jgi:hypothetical protein
MPRLEIQLRLRALILVCVVLAAGLWPADSASPLDLLRRRLGSVPNVFTSSSRQFTVVGHEPGSELGPPSRSSIRKDYLQMEPSLVVVTCERIKSELGYLFRQQQDGWESGITLHIDGRGDPDMPVNVTASYSNRGWQFRIYLPGQVNKRRLIRAVVRALLLDIANRGNPGRLAEVPLWLQEGIAARLYALWGPSIAQGIGTRMYGLDGPKMVVNRQVAPAFEVDYTDLLEPERRYLELFEAIGFPDLHLPHSGQLEGYDWQTFQACSHVFVSELVKLKQGRERLWNSIGLLAKYRNSQMAFMDAFKEVFPTVLAADKWWSVALIDFKSREDEMRWSEARTLARLKDILHVSVTLRRGTNSVPGMKELMFQDLIRETSFAKHRPILIQSIAKLVIMQVNSRRDLARLILDYRVAIEGYVKKQDRAGPGSANLGKLHKQEFTEQFDLLDGIRFDMKLVASPEPKRPVDLARVERLLVEQRRDRVPDKAVAASPIEQLLAAENRRMVAERSSDVGPVGRLLVKERSRLVSEREKIDRLLGVERQRMEAERSVEMSTVERLLIREAERLEKEKRDLDQLEREIVGKR